MSRSVPLTLTGVNWRHNLIRFLRLYISWAVAAALVPISIGTVVAISRLVGWLTVVAAVGVVLLVLLGGFVHRVRTHDSLDAMAARVRQNGGVGVARAEYVEGAERIPVVVWLSEDQFHYENEDLEALFDLDHIDNLELDRELTFGRLLGQSNAVLRLWSRGISFEFLLSRVDAQTWRDLLQFSERYQQSRMAG